MITVMKDRVFNVWLIVKYSIIDLFQLYNIRKALTNIYTGMHYFFSTV